MGPGAAEVGVRVEAEGREPGADPVAAVGVDNAFVEAALVASAYIGLGVVLAVSHESVEAVGSFVAVEAALAAFASDIVVVGAPQPVGGVGLKSAPGVDLAQAVGSSSESHTVFYHRDPYQPEMIKMFDICSIGYQHFLESCGTLIHEFVCSFKVRL